MRVIAEPTGFSLKFDDLEDLRNHTRNLMRMADWCEDYMAEGHRPLFIYTVEPGIQKGVRSLDLLVSREVFQEHLKALPDDEKRKIIEALETIADFIE